MRRIVFIHGLAFCSLGCAALIAACSSDSPSSSSTDAGSNPDSGLDAPGVDATADASPPLDSGTGLEGSIDTGTVTEAGGADAGSDALADAIADAGPVGSLTLILDSTLDIAGDSVKATSITSLDLFDATGVKRASATISGGGAVVNLAGLTAGDYFLQVNGDADDLVPTRIDDPTKDVSQHVGTMLRASLIGPVGTPVYRINTYSSGQAKSGVVKFSDGTAVAPAEQPYMFITISPSKVELKVLGTGASLASYAPSGGVHVSNGVRFDAWIINTNGIDHHGDMFMADGGASTCGGCHANMAAKPSTYSLSTTANGWCFHCHYGAGGSDNGFLDPNK